MWILFALLFCIVNVFFFISLLVRMVDKKSQHLWSPAYVVFWKLVSVMGRLFSWVKVILHLYLEILSLFTHPHVALNPYDFPFEEHKITH